MCVSKEARNGSRELRWLGWWLGTQPSQCVVRREAERGDKQRVCKRPPPVPRAHSSNARGGGGCGK